MKQPIPDDAARMLDLAASLETMRPMFRLLEADLAREEAERDEEDEREALSRPDPVRQALDGWRRALRISQEVM